MTKINNGYLDFRLDDLTGGINTKDYPSEIENKQALDIENFNFNGNRLVSEKGVEDSGNAVKTEIGGLKIDSDDIWTISQGGAYKNGTLITDGTAITLKTNSTTFKSGIYFYFTLDGDSYELTGNDVEDFINNVQTAVELDGYETTKQADIILIKRTDGAPIAYTVTNNQAYVLYNFDNVASYDKGKEVMWNIVIDGTTYTGSYTNNDESLNSGQVDIKIMEDIFTTMPATYKPKIIFLNATDFTEQDDYQYNSGLILNKVTTIDELRTQFNNYNIYNDTSLDDIGFTDYPIFTMDGNDINGSYRYVTDAFSPFSSHVFLSSFEIEGNTFSVNGTMTSTTWTGLVRDQYLALGYNSVSYQRAGDSYALASVWRTDGKELTSSNETITYDGNPANNGPLADKTGNEGIAGIDVPAGSVIQNIVDNINLVSGYSGNAGIGGEALSDTYFRKDDGGTVSITNLETGLILKHTEDYSASIKAHTFENTNTEIVSFSNGTGLDGRANITVGNLGVLIVDKDVGGAHYAYEGIGIKIGENSIGEPTVGTIYNGKIVLGGYADNDNIIFSKTSSPTEPLNVLNFTDYSAGGQSVSGGDKGLVTGMMVGENGLYVFKDNSVWYSNSEKVDGDSSSFNFIFNKITSNGALTQNVITEVDQEIFYLDWKNRAVRRLGYEQNLTTLRDKSVSREIATLFENLPEDQPLATSHFSYPNYQLSLTDGTSALVNYNNGNSYRQNNVHFVYNVENKSWTKRTGITIMLVSDKGHIALSSGAVLKDFVGNGTTNGTFLSKEYTLVDDVDYKRLGEVEFVGDIRGEGGTKKLNIEIIIDGVSLDIGETSTVRTIEALDGETVRYREKIDLFDEGQIIQFKLTHEGSGYVELSDVNFRYKPLKVYHSNYY